MQSTLTCVGARRRSVWSSNRRGTAADNWLAYFGLSRNARSARAGAIKRGNSGDAAVEIGAGPRLATGKGGDLRTVSPRPRLKKKGWVMP